MESLDNILSGRGEAVPAQEIKEEVRTEAPVTETPEQPEVQTQEGEGGGQKMVPHEALHAEKQKVKRYTEQVADFERTLKEREQAWERRFNQLLETVKQPPQPPPTDWFADPDAVHDHRTKEVIAPLQQQLQEQRLALFEDRLYRVAGAEKAPLIEQEIKKALIEGDADIPALQHAVQTQGFAAIPKLVEWYDKRTFDPEKEKERIREELRAELQAEMQQQPQKPAFPTVLPSNIAGARNTGSRSGPAWGGPAPINSILDGRPGK